MLSLFPILIIALGVSITENIPGSGDKMTPARVCAQMKAYADTYGQKRIREDAPKFGVPKDFIDQCFKDYKGK